MIIFFQFASVQQPNLKKTAAEAFKPQPLSWSADQDPGVGLEVDAQSGGGHVAAVTPGQIEIVIDKNIDRIVDVNFDPGSHLKTAALGFGPIDRG
jgi:hypothetical protein